MLAGIGCSGGDSSPVLLSEIPDKDVVSIETVSTNRYLWFTGEVRIDAVDPDNPSWEFVPVRTSSVHLNCLKWLETSPCDDCFQITSISQSGNGSLFIDIAITHPVSLSCLTGFDVRGIAMFDSSFTFPESGLSLSRPELGDGALVNADGFTSLYNSSTLGSGPGGLQGYIPGKLSTPAFPNSLLNGFMRFTSDDPDNARNAFFAGDSVTRRYEVAMPSGEFVFGYAVDVCWDQPESVPVHDPIEDFGPGANCPEPWDISAFVEPVDDGLTPDGGSVEMTVVVKSYTDETTVYNPVLECPDLFTGLITADYHDTYSDGIFYKAILSNENLAEIGRYPCLIKVESKENDYAPSWLDLSSYNVFYLTIDEPMILEDITPPWLNIDPTCVGVSDDYLAIAEEDDLIHIFDLTDPYDPVWLGQLDGYGEPNCMEFAGSALYVLTDEDFHIIDISDPASPYIAKSIDTPFSTDTFAVADGYAYIAGGETQFNIIDVDPPADAFLVGTFATQNLLEPDGLAASGSTLFVTGLGEDKCFQIYDVTDPYTPEFISDLALTGDEGLAIAVSGNFALVTTCDTDGLLNIIDITDPESPTIHHVRQFGDYMENDEQYPMQLFANGNAAIVGLYKWGAGPALDTYWIEIVSLDESDIGETLSTIPIAYTDWPAREFTASGNIVSVLRKGLNESTVDYITLNDISDPSDPVECEVLMFNSFIWSIAVCDGYLLTGDESQVIHILDISDPANTYFTGHVEVSARPRLFVSGNTVYVASYDILVGDPYPHLDIFTFTPPDKLELVGDTNAYHDMGGYSMGLFCTDTLALIPVDAGGDGSDKLEIIDITDPSGPVSLSWLTLPNSPLTVSVSGNSAYVSCTDHMLYIVDISTPASPFIAAEFQVPDSPYYSAYKLDIQGNYIYAAYGSGDVQVISISSPLSPFVIAEAQVHGVAVGVDFYNDHLYVTTGQQGLEIIDVMVPSSPCPVAFIELPDSASNAAIHNGHAYVDVSENGLRIVSLN